MLMDARKKKNIQKLKMTLQAARPIAFLWFCGLWFGGTNWVNLLLLPNY
jgi:hypothetical protein